MSNGSKRAARRQTRSAFENPGWPSGRPANKDFIPVFSSAANCGLIEEGRAI
jgi:hypothetical protein